MGGLVSTYLFRKYVRLKIRRSHNEAVGYVFAVLGGFYGLLMGFVVFLVWSSANDAQNNASREGSLARALYRDIRYFPDTAEMKPLMNSYINYVHYVINEEYPTMEQMKPLTAASHTDFDDVFRQMEKLDAREPKIEQMFTGLNELATYRSLRQLDASSEIPIEIWIPLLLGALIILLFSVMIDVESTRLHIVINGLLGAFIGLVIYLVIILDHPFTGKIKIKPTEYQTILQMNSEAK
ncbi:bestrophin-like domain [Mucilaginibacter sp.]